MRKLVFGTLITIVLVGAVLLIERSIRVNRPITTESTSTEDGKPLPSDAKLKNFATKEVVGFEKYRGKVVLINFWASWCEACMAEMPSINKLYNTLKADGLEVLAINVDDNPEQVVPGILQKLKLDFPVFTDLEGNLAEAFGVVAIPYSVVADKQGKIFWAESGERDWATDKVVEEMRKLVRK